MVNWRRVDIINPFKTRSIDFHPDSKLSNLVWSNSVRWFSSWCEYRFHLTAAQLYLKVTDLSAFYLVLVSWFQTTIQRLGDSVTFAKSDICSSHSFGHINIWCQKVSHVSCIITLRGIMFLHLLCIFLLKLHVKRFYVFSVWFIFIYLFILAGLHPSWSTHLDDAHIDLDSSFLVLSCL